MDKNMKKNYIKLTLLIIIFIALSLGATYAFLNLRQTNNNTTGKAGCFDISYTGTEIKHTNLSVTTNYLEGVNSTVTIAKEASCKIYNEAYIYIHVNDDITAPIETVQALRYKVMQGNNQIGEGLITNKGEVLLATVPITTTSTTYNIYIWVDSSLSNKQYDNVKFTGYIYAESDQTSTIENTKTVTFNPNGGSVSPTTKQVLYRHPYESLPTPTRSGYTFKGWTGKNLFTGLTKGIGINLTTGENANYSNSAASNFISVDFSNNRKYSISGLEQNLYSLVTYYNQNKEYLGRIGAAGRATMLLNGNIDVTTSATGGIKYLKLVQYENVNVSGNIDLVDNLKIQLEEGSVNTEYEPHYITSSTLVAQNQNHTLTAIWE